MILKKIGEEYKLYGEDDSCIATTQESPHKKLSKQNCDEIFEIFDVEKLACDECHIDISAYKIIQTLKSGHSKSELQLESKVDGFILGFNKAVALNKDKLFTLEDMKKAYIQGKHGGKTQSYVEFDDFIQSLQQPTEIEVEIEQVLVQSSIQGEAIWRYKLDENLCLILKKL